jgi:hypothetical protein
MKYSLFVSLVLASAALAAPAPAFTLQNGQDAIALNNKFKTLKAGSSCKAGENACIDQKFAQCVGGKFVTQACGAGTICAALPLVNRRGTSITCTTQSDVDRRIAATGAKVAAASDPNNGECDPNQPAAANNTGNNNTGNNNGGAKGKVGNGVDPQTSFTLDPAVIAPGFAKNGQETPTPGQVASLTSTNNFINFCLTAKNFPITDGKQIKTGSCNPAPIGLIPATNNMPSCKFVFPKNNDVIEENKSFDIKLAIKKLETGNFVNAQTNYFAAPQQLNKQGQVIGHSHVVVERVTGLGQTEPTDPNVFAFFKGVNDKADKNGILTATVDKGLPEGTYRLASIIAAANHQPVIVPVAQRGTLDDAIYFQVKKKGGNGGKNN